MGAAKSDFVSARGIDSKRRFAHECNVPTDYICALIASCMCRSENGPIERNKCTISSHNGKDPLPGMNASTLVGAERSHHYITEFCSVAVSPPAA